MAGASSRNPGDGKGRVMLAALTGLHARYRYATVDDAGELGGSDVERYAREDARRLAMRTGVVVLLYGPSGEAWRITPPVHGQHRCRWVRVDADAQQDDCWRHIGEIAPVKQWLKEFAG